MVSFVGVRHLSSIDRLCNAGGGFDLGSVEATHDVAFVQRLISGNDGLTVTYSSVLCIK